jgi:hypothetical protein
MKKIIIAMSAVALFTFAAGVARAEGEAAPAKAEKTEKAGAKKGKKDAKAAEGAPAGDAAKTETPKK